MSNKFLVVVAVVGSLSIVACAPGRRNTNPLKPGTTTDKADAQGKDKNNVTPKTPAPVIITRHETNGTKITKYEITLPNNQGKNIIEIADGSDEATVKDASGAEAKLAIKTERSSDDKEVRTIENGKSSWTETTEKGLPIRIKSADGTIRDFGNGILKTVKITKDDVSVEVLQVSMASVEEFGKEAVDCEKLGPGQACAQSDDGIVIASVTGLPVSGDKTQLRNAKAARNSSGIGFLVEVSNDEGKTFQNLELFMYFPEARPQGQAQTQGQDQAAAPQPEKQTDKQQEQQPEKKDDTQQESGSQPS